MWFYFYDMTVRSYATFYVSFLWFISAFVCLFVCLCVCVFYIYGFYAWNKLMLCYAIDNTLSVVPIFWTNDLPTFGNKVGVGLRVNHENTATDTRLQL